MRKTIIKFLSFFIPNSKKRKAFRKCFNTFPIYFVLWGKRYYIKGKNNKVIISWGKKEYILPKFLAIKGLKIKIEGNNNTIKIEFPIYRFENNSFQISGDNNTISLKRSRFIIHNFKIGSHWGKNRLLFMDEDLSVDGCFLWMEDEGTSIRIGKDCMFSHDLFFRHSDGHCVIDENGQVLNKAKEMIIGNHVWIGAWTRLCKNVCIPDGCIVGMGSIVTKKFTEKNAVIAGNPAKVVKQNVHWIRESINYYSERIENASIYKRRKNEKTT